MYKQTEAGHVCTGSQYAVKVSRPKMCMNTQATHTCMIHDMCTQGDATFNLQAWRWQKGQRRKHVAARSQTHSFKRCQGNTAKRTMNLEWSYCTVKIIDSDKKCWHLLHFHRPKNSLTWVGWVGCKQHHWTIEWDAQVHEPQASFITHTLHLKPLTRSQVSHCIWKPVVSWSMCSRNNQHFQFPSNTLCSVEHCLKSFIDHFQASVIFLIAAGNGILSAGCFAPKLWHLDKASQKRYWMGLAVPCLLSTDRLYFLHVS